MVSVNKCLIYTSGFCDLIPVVSTVTNLATFGFKAIAAQRWLPLNIQNSDFAQYLIGKSKLRCAVLLVPRYGNIAFAVSKLFRLVGSKCKEFLEFLPPNDEIPRIHTEENMQRAREHGRKKELLRMMVIDT